MTLPDTPSAEAQLFSVVLSSSTYADSPSDALGMFMAQMQSGNVTVEIHNAESNESWDLADLDDQNRTDQIALAMGLLKRNCAGITGHERVELLLELRRMLGSPGD